ncbi:MAG: DNA/RNA non-specific endonuclease [Bacteroidales bacterium]|nr:DNA/RNA non-specific endonuclease [Bacteroidales bacterium]
MKRLMLSLLTVLSVFGSCSQTEPVGTVREMQFRAYTETDALTRTSLGSDHRSILWSSSDEISVFDKSSASNNRFSNTAAAGATATFSGMAPADQYYLALYPYQAEAVLEDEGETLVATLPSEQTAVAGSFGPGANPAVAYTEMGGDLFFRNIGGLLSFTFSTSHTVKSVKISASGDAMSGRAALMMDAEGAPSVEAYADDAYNSVTLSGTFSSGQTYYAVVLPGSFSGLKIVFTDKNGATASYSNPISLYLDRNENISLGSFSIPESKWRTQEADEYVKVNQEYDDWSGRYLIVAGDAYAANGTVTSKWLGNVPVSVSNGKIARTSTTKEYEVTVAKVSGTEYYSLKFANGNYLGSTNSNDGIKTATSAPTSSSADFLWTFEYDTDGKLVKIKLAQYPSRILRLNGTNGFRTYTGETGSQATLFRGPSGDGQQEETAITSSNVLSRNTTSARLTASYQSITSTPSQAGFKYGKTESLGSTVRTTDALAQSGTFTAELTGLEEGTLYYYQPYIVVDGITYVGTLKNFRTASESPGSGGRGWFELPAQKDVDHNGIDDDNPDYYYSWTMRADASSIRNFSACYSKSMKHPVWVAAPMHTSYTGSSGRNDSYKNDPAISCEQTGKFDGYTRGHMLGSSDRTVSKPTNRQVFYYSNIGAQLQSGFNTGGGAWNNLESLVDEQWCADTLYQVIGCIFETFTDRYGTTVAKKTGSGSAGTFQVPTAWYKVLLRTKNGSTGKRVDECTSDELKCVGFILTHRSNAGHKPSSQDMYSVSYIESLTGLTFFPNVPDAPKDSYKASDWGL